MYGLRFTLDLDAYDVTNAAAGLFICTGMYVTVYHYGTEDYDESLDHASFEKIPGSGTEVPGAWTTLTWGGGPSDEFYNFGIPVETEDLLCLHADGTNIEVLLTFMNVCQTWAGAPGSEVATWATGRLTMQDPVLSYYFDGKPYYMQCLEAEELGGDLPVWTNIANACTASPNPAPYVVVDPRDTCAIRFKFGWATEEDADDARLDAPHKCLEETTGHQVIKAAVWTNADPNHNLSSLYTVDGEVCYKRLPCENDDDSDERIVSYEAEQSCDVVACRPAPETANCSCLEGPDDWIWTDTESVEWTDGQNAVWTDSLTCGCGCEHEDLDLVLGLPSYLSLPKVGASGGVVPDGLAFQMCLSYFAVVSGGGSEPVCAIFAHADQWYGLNNETEFPFLLRWNVASSTWVAEFKGRVTGANSTFTVTGPIPSGIIDCSWHSVKLEYVGGSGWRLGVDINAGIDYDWGPFQPEPSGFSMHAPTTYYWGCPDRVEPDVKPNSSYGEYSPPNSLILS